MKTKLFLLVALLALVVTGCKPAGPDNTDEDPTLMEYTSGIASYAGVVEGTDIHKYLVVLSDRAKDSEGYYEGDGQSIYLTLLTEAPATEESLLPETYEILATGAVNTIQTGTKTYLSTIKDSGESKMRLASGSVTIEVEGSEYTFSGLVKNNAAKEFEIKFTGAIEFVGNVDGPEPPAPTKAVFTKSALIYGQKTLGPPEGHAYLLILTNKTPDNAGDFTGNEALLSLKINVVNLEEGELALTEYKYSAQDKGGNVFRATMESYYLPDGDNATKKITGGLITISKTETDYVITGNLNMDKESLEFSYTGELPYYATKPATTTVGFVKDITLGTSNGLTATYEKILWGLERAEDNGEGVKIFDDILYSESGLNFPSFYSDKYETFDMWGGVAFSYNYDKENVGVENQFSAYTRYATSNVFAVLYDLGGFNDSQYERPIITLDAPKTLVSIDVTNTVFAYDYCANTTVKDFYFDMIVTGYNAGVETGSAKISLAKDGKIVGDWTRIVGLSELGSVDKLAFTFDSNDKTGEYLNVPAYCCIDNIVVK